MGSDPRIFALGLLLAALPAFAAPYSWPTGSRSAVAQREADQGFVMAYGFDTPESVRAFEAATREDPRCLPCWWGLAWAQGPTINADMADGAHRSVLAALAKARALAPRASPRDRALVAALSARHPPKGAIDEEAYARQMSRLADRWPADADIATLAAESLMNLHPYDWWEADGRPRPWTPEIERRLDQALRANPDHPGALHYQVHLYESSKEPQRALRSADRLRTLVPGAAHLLHMPSHIDLRTGRYEEAIEANRRAIERDRASGRSQGSAAYRVGYAAHNHHFLWAAAAMAGREDLAMEAAREAYTVACGPKPGDLSSATLQHLAALTLYTQVRFGRWDEILHRTLPPDTPLPYPRAVFHFARGMAAARTGRIVQARDELGNLERVAADPTLATAKVKNINPLSDLVRIARHTLAAAIAEAEGEVATALAHLRRAVEIEDGLAYDEPHLWLAPTRQALGTALLAAGRPTEAARAFREDLAHYPRNAVSSAGLAKAVTLGSDPRI